jgi:MOSC domain-containing protein YiiM
MPGSAALATDMQITVLNVNTAKPETIATKSGETGIFKRPRQGPVYIGETGVSGDVIVDLRNHGGKDQAVYLYGREDYEWWERELGRSLEPGTFGENLTISGLESATVCIGDRYRIGGVLLEVTSPRIPCNTFAVRMGDPHFIKRFMEGKRPGSYCRVLETGNVAAGDFGTAAPYSGEKVTLLELLKITPTRRCRWKTANVIFPCQRIGSSPLSCAGRRTGPDHALPIRTPAANTSAPPSKT